MLESESLYNMSGQFYTSISRLQSFDSITVVNTLADNVLKDQIILKNEIVLPITVFASYVFNLSINSQYNDTKFKEFFIDSDASIQSSWGISPLKALQHFDTSVQLNKNTARLVNLIFRIGSIVFIGSIYLDTPLEQITFYIVPVNTLFLLCLADIDKYRAFFKNITYQVI